MKINFGIFFYISLCAVQLHGAAAPDQPLQPSHFPFCGVYTLANKMQHYFRVSNPALYKQLPQYQPEQLKQMEDQLADPGADKKYVTNVFDTVLREQDQKEKKCHKKCMWAGGVVCGALLATELGLWIAANNVRCP